MSTEAQTETLALEGIEEAEPEAQRVSNEQAEQIAMARRRVTAAQAREDEAKADHASAKKRREALDEELGNLLDDILSGQARLFDADKQTDEPASDEWRSLPMGELTEHDLSPAIVKRLVDDCAILTLGDLSARMASGDHWADEIEGIGKAKVEQIDNAVAAFWQAHPEYCQGTPDTPAPEADEGE